MSEKSYAIGRLLRANISGFVAGTRVLVQDAPRFGSMVRAPLGQSSQIYGLIHDIHIDEDGLVRQLVTNSQVDEAVIADNRENRNVPLEISVIAIGYQQDDRILHLLPPRPPLSLDVLHECSDEEVIAFTSGGFGYLRHLVRNLDLPTAELIAAHINEAKKAYPKKEREAWMRSAAEEVVTLLRDDYPKLMQILGALGDAIPKTGGAR